MSETQIILYFMMADRRIVPARAFLDDPALNASERPLETGAGGIKIVGEDDRILIQDDLDNIDLQLLTNAPDRLEAGEDVSFAYNYSDDGLEIRQADGVAVIDDRDGAEIPMPVSDLVAGLRQAHSELQALRAAS